MVPWRLTMAPWGSPWRLGGSLWGRGEIHHGGNCHIILVSDTAFTKFEINSIIATMDV
jgi:hypothetical protein